MLIYIFSFFVVLFPALFDDNSFFRRADRNICVVLILVFLSLIVGLRDMIGGSDVYIYGEFFDSLSLDQFSDGTYLQFLLFEKGYTLYNYCVHCFTDNRYIYFFITAIVSYFLIYRSIRQCSCFVLFSLFIFYCKFFLMSFVYVRQFLAMGIIWFAIPYIVNRDFVKFLLIVILSSTLHSSAFVFLLTYFVGTKQFSKKVLSIIMMMSIVAGFTAVVKYTFVFYGDASGLSKAINYGNSAVGMVNVFYLLESLLLGIAVIYFRDKLYVDKWSICLTNISFCYVCFSFLTMRDATMIRLIWYFFIGYIFVIPNICFLLKNKSVLIKPFVVLYFSLLFFRLLFLWDGGDMLPYKTFLQDYSRNSRWEYLEYDINYLSNRLYK